MALKVGIQLYSVRQAMAKDPVGTIREVAGLGYKYIEVANHHALEDFGVDAAELNRIMSDTGAGVVSATPRNHRISLFSGSGIAL